MAENFRQLLEQLMAQQSGITRNPPMRAQTANPTQEGTLMDLLMLLQQGAEASRPMRQQTSPLQPFAPGSGGPIFSSPPDAGDVYDYHNSNGDPGLLGLFGSPDPVPLRAPARGVNPRRPYRRGMP